MNVLWESCWMFYESFMRKLLNFLLKFNEKVAERFMIVLWESCWMFYESFMRKLLNVLRKFYETVAKFFMKVLWKSCGMSYECFMRKLLNVLFESCWMFYLEVAECFIWKLLNVLAISVRSGLQWNNSWSPFCLSYIYYASNMWILWGWGYSVWILWGGVLCVDALVGDGVLCLDALGRGMSMQCRLYNYSGKYPLIRSV